MLHDSPILHGSKNPHQYSGITAVILSNGNLLNPFAVPCVHFAALRLVRSNALRSARHSLLRLCFAKLLALLVGQPDTFGAGVSPSDSLRSSSAHVSGELQASRLPRLPWLKIPRQNIILQNTTKIYNFLPFSITFLQWGQSPQAIRSNIKPLSNS